MATIFEIAFECSYNLEAISRVRLQLNKLTNSIWPPCIASAFQISTVFAVVLEDYNMEYVQIVDAMEDEIYECDAMIERHLQMYDEAILESVHRNMPPVAGHLRWATELKDRLDSNLDRFKIMENQE